LTDFGIARKKRPDNSRDTSGTPGYMAPEVMFRTNHSYEVDYFAMGIILFELMTGSRPYYGKDRKEIRE
jgi:serine/threonine protein kinase